MAFDLRIGEKLSNVISLYRSPNQSYDNYRSPNQSDDDFVSFPDNFEITLYTLAQKNPFFNGCTLVLSPAIGIIKILLVMKAEKTEAVTSQNRLHQEINEPTRVLNNSSYCIDNRILIES